MKYIHIVNKKELWQNKAASYKKLSRLTEWDVDLCVADYSNVKLEM